MKKNRSTLKDYFKKGLIPTEAQFADLIDSMLNQEEDNVDKLPNDPLSVTAVGADEALLNFYRIEQNEKKLSWQLKQKVDGKPGLSVGDGTSGRLFIKSDTGEIGIGTNTPKQTLDVRGRVNVENGVIQRGGEAITSTSDLGLYSQVDKNWIRIVSTNAPIRFYNDSGVGTKHSLSIEASGDLLVTGNANISRKRLGFSGSVTDVNHSIYNNGLDIDGEGGWDGIKMNVFAGLDVRVGDANGRKPASALYIDNQGRVGIGMSGPIAKLDVQQEARSGTDTHPKAGNGLYVTGGFAADGNGVEFRHSNGTQGIGFGYNTIYATGSNANQDLGLKARGTGQVVVTGNLSVAGNLHTQRKRVAFSNTADDANHTVYNNYNNIDGEGAWDGMKMNVYAGLDVRVGNANGATPTSALYVDNSANLRVTGYLASKQICFSAYVDRNDRSGNQSPLPMQAVSQNVGNCYDANTSKFTSPVKGLYLFTMTGMRVEGTDWLNWFLRVNDGYANSGGSAGESTERCLMSWYSSSLKTAFPLAGIQADWGLYATVSRTILLLLNKGDTVWIEQQGSGRCDNYRSGLEGALLSAIS